MITVKQACCCPECACPNIETGEVTESGNDRFPPRFVCQQCSQNDHPTRRRRATDWTPDHPWTVVDGVKVDAEFTNSDSDTRWPSPSDVYSTAKGQLRIRATITAQHGATIHESALEIELDVDAFDANELAAKLSTFFHQVRQDANALARKVRT